MDIKMFQMGFGESILIYDKKNCLLVDFGSESDYKDLYFSNVIKELKNYNDKSLLISHFHSDHINGIEDLSKKFLKEFNNVYIPNIFRTGDRSLDLLITQYLLEGIFIKGSKYHLLSLLYDLLKAKLNIYPVSYGDCFKEVFTDFQVLRPIPNDKYIIDIWEEVKEELTSYNLPIVSEELIEDIRRFVFKISSVNEDYNRKKLEDEIKSFINIFNETQKKYINIVKENVGNKKLKEKIKELYKKIKTSINETSIVFHTLDNKSLQILMTGDVSNKTMSKIINNNSSIAIKKHYDVFKVPHHGTNSSYYDFSSQFSCDRLLISNGETNMSKRGEISDKYILNNKKYEIVCTNTVHSRCKYILDNEKRGHCCSNCRVSDLSILCGFKKSIPKIVFNPSDINDFKKEFIKVKEAKITWEYNDGNIYKTDWHLKKFNNKSNVKNNIKTRSQWKNKDKNGLVKVLVEIL